MCSLPGEAAAEFGSSLTEGKARKAFPGPGGCFPLNVSCVPESWTLQAGVRAERGGDGSKPKRPSLPAAGVWTFS